MNLTPQSVEALVSRVVPLDAIIGAARSHGVKVYLGGGTLRDLGLSHPDAADLDFIVEGPPEKTGPFISLAKSALVPVETSQAVPLDFSPCKSARHFVHQFDFTVNSILFDLDSKAISCPTTGIQDLEQRILRMNSPTFFVTSYRSFVRVFRLAVSRHMTIDASVRESIRQYHPMIAYAAPAVRTKVYLDLVALLCEPEFADAIEKLADVEILFTLFPHLLIDKEHHQKGDSWEMRAFPSIQTKIGTLPEGQRARCARTSTALAELNGQSYRVQYSGQALLGLAVLISEIGSAMQRLDAELPMPFSKAEYAINGRRALVRDLLLSLAPLHAVRDLFQQALLLNELAEGVVSAKCPPEMEPIVAVFSQIKATSLPK